MIMASLAGAAVSFTQSSSRPEGTRSPQSFSRDGREPLLFHSTTAFDIGGLAVKWYGLFIMTGVIVATLLAYRIAPLKGEDPEHIWGLLPYLVVFGIVGARIAYGIVRH